MCGTVNIRLYKQPWQETVTRLMEIVDGKIANTHKKRTSCFTSRQYARDTIRWGIIFTIVWFNNQRWSQQQVWISNLWTTEEQNKPVVLSSRKIVSFHFASEFIIFNNIFPITYLFCWTLELWFLFTDDLGGSITTPSSSSSSFSVSWLLPTLPCKQINSTIRSWWEAR